MRIEQIKCHTPKTSKQKTATRKPRRKGNRDSAEVSLTMQAYGERMRKVILEPWITMVSLCIGGVLFEVFFEASPF